MIQYRKFSLQKISQPKAAKIKINLRSPDYFQLRLQPYLQKNKKFIRNQVRKKSTESSKGCYSNSKESKVPSSPSKEDQLIPTRTSSYSRKIKRW